LSKPCSMSTSGVTVAPSSNSLRSLTLTVAKCVPNALLLNPRFGMRHNSGIWPPSNPKRIEPPERAVWPLPPRPEVLPCPELSPMPSRFVRCFAPGRFFKLCKRIVMSARSCRSMPRHAAHTENFGSGTQLFERVQRGLDHVNGIARTQRFAQHITHADHFEHRAHAATGNDAGPRACRAQ